MTESLLPREAFEQQTLDYIEGTLPAASRSVFEATLRAHPEWAEEVQSLSRTWQRSREILKRGEEAAPSRVRNHVFAEAAKRAAVLRGQHEPVSIAKSRESSWQSLRRWLAVRPWFAPALVATAAISLFALNRQMFTTKSVPEVML